MILRPARATYLPTNKTFKLDPFQTRPINVFPTNNTTLCRSGSIDSDPSTTAANGPLHHSDSTHQPVQLRFFRRPDEIAYLDGLLDDYPEQIILLVGPQNGGKTALLNEIARRRVARQELPPVMTINCRAVDISSPASAAMQLQKLAADKKKSLEKVLGAAKELEKKLERLNVTVTPTGINLDFGKLFGNSSSGDLASTVTAFTELLKTLKPLVYKPIIVIDEANVLMDWKEEGDGDAGLRLLLRFFVMVTKEAQLAHVVLVTSDWSLISWLAGKGLDTKQRLVEVVGNLTHDEAKRYFFGDEEWPGLIDSPVPTVTEELWEQIYAICGGNIGLLRRCANQAKAWKNWDNALEIIRQGPAALVRSGFRPNILPKRHTSPPSWTVEQYKIALRSIAEAPHHVILMDELMERLGKTRRGWRVWRRQPPPKYTGETALLSMIEYRLLDVRPRSQLAKDLPKEVYGEEDGAPLVAMPSAAELHYVLQLYKAGKLN